MPRGEGRVRAFGEEGRAGTLKPSPLVYNTQPGDTVRKTLVLCWWPTPNGPFILAVQFSAYVWWGTFGWETDHSATGHGYIGGFGKDLGSETAVHHCNGKTLRYRRQYNNSRLPRRLAKKQTATAY